VEWSAVDEPEWEERGSVHRSTFVSRQTTDLKRAAQVSKNVACSILAYSPLIPTLAAMMLVVGLVQLTYVVIAFGAAVGAVLSVVFAREDARTLRSRGFSETAIPSPYIASVAPWLYLWLRGNGLFLADPRSLRPFWQHVGLTLVFLLTVLVFPTIGGIGRMLLELQ
jgi:hypothetical protein